MKHDINPGNVEWVAKKLNESLGNGQFSTGEVILGAAEFVGRMIVTVADTPVAGFNVAQVLEDHIKKTLVCGYTARGFNMGEEG
jgi:hypothetical protein